MKLPSIGKLDKKVFDEVISPKLGWRNKKVLILPKHGVDAAAIRISRETVMVVAEDPTFGMPVLMPFFGWAIVHICASDVTVLGAKPRYMLISLLLPPNTPIETPKMVWNQIDN